MGRTQAANKARGQGQGCIRYGGICEISMDSQIFEISDILLEISISEKKIQGSLK